jgi:TP53 regulating kinase-like protein
MNETEATNIPGPPVPSFHNESWKLISQGAEARVWLVPNFIQTNISNTSTSLGTSSITSTIICKERFPKAYRHPALDETLTRSRTKAEAKNLIRCRRGGVSVPLVLGVDLNSAKKNDAAQEGGEKYGFDEKKSACLFLEYVHGVTIRSFLNVEVDMDANHTLDGTGTEAPSKKQKIDTDDAPSNRKKIVTRMDDYAKRASYEVGATIARMHNANIVHGDLTTSNIMLRNPDIPDGESSNEWKPDIVLIDFGLSSTSTNSKKTSCHEERAVDLNVLERAFVTTHVGSEDLVKEAMRGYKATCQSSDSVFVRLAQVRMRGRKRECFG